MICALPYNEPDLLRDISRGNEKAFTVLVNGYKDNLYTSAYRIVGSKALAEDILQNVFLKLWLHRDKLPAIDNLQAYIYTMTQHAIFDALRKIAARRENSLAPDAGDAHFAPADADQRLQEREYESILRKAIESLPPRQKQTYILIKQEGLKRNETADLLNVSSETVKFNLEQAVRKVRAFCEAHLTSVVVLLALIKNIL